MDSYVGKRIDGRYEIREIIGVGGMAVVYKAYDNIDDRIVAVKILKEEFLANEEFRRRFKNESKAIAVLSHPNIVKVFDVSFGDRLQYIVMEYVEGITLKEYIEQQQVINCKEVVHFTTQILRALQHAHDKGIVHRDIKPQNIILLQNGNIKVTDFGIARFSRSETRTMTDSAIGSVHYVSPEQARGDMTDEKTDIYSVGVLMYEMLTGQLPFQSDSAISVALMQVNEDAVPPSAINEDIPTGLEQITMRAMQKIQRDRYQTAAEMLLDIEEYKRNPAVVFGYSYFVDDNPTKFVSSEEVRNFSGFTPVQEDMPIPNADEMRLPHPKTKKKKSALPVIVGILAGILVVLLLAAGYIVFQDEINAAIAPKVSVPDIVSLNYYSDVKGVDKYDDFKFEIQYTVTDEYEDGEILKQNPEKGTKIKSGDTITITIAVPVDEITIPDLADEDGYSAKSELNNLGLLYIEEFENSATVDEGCVIRTEPAAGSSIKPGETVTLVICQKDDTMVAVPDIVTMPLEMAEHELESAGLTLDPNYVQEGSTVVAEGNIIRCEPIVGTMVEKGTAIKVVVSLGERAATRDITIILPAGGDGSIVYKLNGSIVHTKPSYYFYGEMYTVPVTGVGTNDTVEVYVCDNLYFSCNIDFTTPIPTVTNVVDHTGTIDYGSLY
ncbi:MAG: Stk1 family PASTA domain-containing Ser/Thr kinase [Ruminococcaceae bacterium]|nr:Stk1 family PASTA domain-containing Ser/Thr kinase [Oscillospiraceae bacterium]